MVTEVEFGEFLKHMRKSIQMPATKFGELLGVHHTTLLRWEKGKNLSRVDTYLLEQKVREIVKDELRKRRLEVSNPEHECDGFLAS